MYICTYAYQCNNRASKIHDPAILMALNTATADPVAGVTMNIVGNMTGYWVRRVLNTSTEIQARVSSHALDPAPKRQQSPRFCWMPSVIMHCSFGRAQAMVLQEIDLTWRTDGFHGRPFPLMGSMLVE